MRRCCKLPVCSIRRERLGSQACQEARCHALTEQNGAEPSSAGSAAVVQRALRESCFFGVANLSESLSSCSKWTKSLCVISEKAGVGARAQACRHMYLRMPSHAGLGGETRKGLEDMKSRVPLYPQSHGKYNGLNRALLSQTPVLPYQTGSSHFVRPRCHGDNEGIH